MKDPLVQALESLPHGAEFRFLDRLLELEPGSRGVGEYSVRGDESFLRGHFPGDPLFPGVLIIEAAAQLAGTVAQCDPAIAPLQALKLTGIRGIKILGTARPGQKIILRARVTGRFANLIQAEVSATVDQADVLRGEVMLSGDAAT